MQIVPIMSTILYTLWVQTVHTVGTKNIIILKLKRKENLFSKRKGRQSLLRTKKFFSTEFLRMYLVYVKNTTYIVSTKLSILYIVV